MCIVQDEVVPSPLTSWRAHDGEITSLQLVMHTVHQLIVSGGTDCSVRLWNMSGHYIGTFGQVYERGMPHSHVVLIVL